MEQFIGCDAHKKFSVFVAVNEKGQAGEALRVAHERQLTASSLRDSPRILPSRWKPVVATVGWWMRWNSRVTALGYAIRMKPSDAWA